ncbi:MAG TPA: hypothetical protein VD973_23130 [Symbiobacteriaceae bacterium]|nr:hypothetical protein [Symbiobacteriaceae bacterium]
MKGLTGGKLAVLAVVAVAVTIVATVLLNRPAPAAQLPDKLSVGMHTKDYAVSFRMDPLAPGRHTVEVKLGDHDGTPLPAEPKIDLTAYRSGDDTSKHTIAGTYLGEGRYQFDQVLISQPGAWFFELQVMEPGAPEPKQVKLDFEVPNR